MRPNFTTTFGVFRRIDPNASKDAKLLEGLIPPLFEDLTERIEETGAIPVGGYDLALARDAQGWTVLRAEGRGLLLAMPPLLPRLRLVPWWKPS